MTHYEHDVLKSVRGGINEVAFKLLWNKPWNITFCGIFKLFNHR